jgi:hypothetical protein
MQWPTAEETGAPPPGSTVEEHNAFHDKYGRTPLHPRTVKELLDCQGAATGLVAAIISTASASHPDADRFFEHVDRLLAHVPERGKTNGLERNFAGQMRATLASLENKLPRALALLMALDAKLKSRKRVEQVG